MPMCGMSSESGVISSTMHGSLETGYSDLSSCMPMCRGEQWDWHIDLQLMLEVYLLLAVKEEAPFSFLLNSPIVQILWSSMGLT